MTNWTLTSPRCTPHAGTYFLYYETMRPPIYDTQDVLEFAEMQERTNDAAEELEEAFLEIQHNHMLSKREVLFTQARMVDSFIRMEEDYEFDESKRIDAEAVFNDYYMACRDLCEESDSEPTLNEQGN